MKDTDLEAASAVNDKTDYERGYNDAVEECAKIAERFTLGFVVDDHGAPIADEIRQLLKNCRLNPHISRTP